MTLAGVMVFRSSLLWPSIRGRSSRQKHCSIDELTAVPRRDYRIQPGEITQPDYADKLAIHPPFVERGGEYDRRFGRVDFRAVVVLVRRRGKRMNGRI